MSHHTVVQSLPNCFFTAIRAHDMQLKRVDFNVDLKFAIPEIQASDLTDGAEYEVAKRGPGLPGGTL